jgi:hypothetical protein
MKGRRVLVITTFAPPPIPDRNHDWSARLDNYEPGQPLGHGPSEAEAVFDLFIEIEIAEDEDSLED